MITQRFRDQLSSVINALPISYDPGATDLHNRIASLETAVANALQRIGQLEAENQQMLDIVEGMTNE